MKKTHRYPLFVQTPRQQCRSSNLIELQAGPISGAVEPTVLREASIWPLNGSEPDQSAQRRAGLAGGEKRSCALYQVASPYQVITPEVCFALCLAPGNAQGCDHRALKNFVLMGQQHATAQAVHSAAIAGHRRRDDPQMVPPGKGSTWPLSSGNCRHKQRRW